MPGPPIGPGTPPPGGPPVQCATAPLPQKGGKKRPTRKQTQPLREPTDEELGEWKKEQGR